MSKTYIYGAGIQGQVFFDVFRAQGLAVDGFIDAYSPKPTYNGLRVLRAERVPDRDAEIYISVGLISSRIKADLMARGFARVFDYTDSVLNVPGLIPALKVLSLWYSDNPADMIDATAIARFRTLLGDQESRRLLDRVARFRLDSSTGNYIVPDTRVQYFPADIAVFAGLDAVRFVDAGAYTGDTLNALWRACRERALPLEFAACFEPDSDNLETLHRTVSGLRQEGFDARVFVYPTGVWRRSEMLYFESGRAASSCIADQSGPQEASAAVFCLSIDESLFEAAPNFIKMDIEGAEQDAIEGARRTIQTHRPVLAISLYHRSRDLWEIPLLIQEIAPGYAMYLRVYGDMLLETVLYCLPRRPG